MAIAGVRRSWHLAMKFIVVEISPFNMNSGKPSAEIILLLWPSFEILSKYFTRTIVHLKGPPAHYRVPKDQHYARATEWLERLSAVRKVFGSTHEVSGTEGLRFDPCLDHWLMHCPPSDKWRPGGNNEEMECSTLLMKLMV